MSKKLIFIGLMGASLSGCAAISEIGSSTISPSVALVAANSFDALEVVATGYLQLRPCGSIPCRTTAAVSVIVPAVRSGRAARNQIEALLNTNSGAAIPVATYNTLKAAITSLQAVYTQYNIQAQ